MQRALDATSKWCDDWGFTISITKTVAVLFSRGKTATNYQKLLVNNQEIKYDKSAKFLGVIFDQKLT